MSDSGKTAKPPPIVDDAIVAQARTALGGFFSDTIKALGADMQARLKQNGDKPSHVSEAASNFTVQMIELLASRVESVLPQTATTPAAPAAEPPAAPTGKAKSAGRA
jgi:hypothetical protein